MRRLDYIFVVVEIWLRQHINCCLISTYYRCLFLRITVACYTLGSRIRVKEKQNFGVLLSRAKPKLCDDAQVKMLVIVLLFTKHLKWRWPSTNCRLDVRSMSPSTEPASAHYAIKLIFNDANVFKKSGRCVAQSEWSFCWFGISLPACRIRTYLPFSHTKTKARSGTCMDDQWPPAARATWSLVWSVNRRSTDRLQSFDTKSKYSSFDRSSSARNLMPSSPSIRSYS